MSLNKVFLQVLHGAESDVVWLQQNFNLYLVNLFDTYHATHLLNFPRHGLATLLELYADFSPDKRYQLADWCIRPLPADTARYVRTDAHFLLSVYDCVCNAPLDCAPRLQEPRRQGGRRWRSGTYSPASAGPGGWDTLATKWNMLANLAADARPSVQHAVYVAMHASRGEGRERGG